MSVYIKSMEMPWCEHQEIDIRRGIDGKWYAIDDDWYEIIPVPDHGRLIDADALDYFKDDSGIAVFDFVTRGQIKTAPTIIPADKENGE